MRKFLFIALLLSFAGCIPATEGISNYLSELKRKAHSAYKGMGGVQGLKDAMVSNLSPIGSRIREHTKCITSKINSLKMNKVVPHAKRIYSNIKEKISSEIEKRKEPTKEEKTANTTGPSETPENSVPLEEDDEERIKGIEELLRNIINSMKNNSEMNGQDIEEYTENDHEENAHTSQAEPEELSDSDEQKKEEFKKDL